MFILQKFTPHRVKQLPAEFTCIFTTQLQFFRRIFNQRETQNKQLKSLSQIFQRINFLGIRYQEEVITILTSLLDGRSYVSIPRIACLQQPLEILRGTKYIIRPLFVDKITRKLLSKTALSNYDTCNVGRLFTTIQVVDLF